MGSEAQHDIELLLKEAAEALATKQPKEALVHCKQALKLDKNSYEALILIGKSAILLQEYQQAELAFTKAKGINADLVPAWLGLSELYAINNNVAALIDADEHLVEITGDEDPMGREARLRLSEAYIKTSQHTKAIAQLQTLLATEPPGSSHMLELLCRLADIQLKLDEVKAAEEVEARLASPTGGLRDRTMSHLQLDVLSEQAKIDDEAGDASLISTLAAICNTAPPALKYLNYREEMLKRCLLRSFSAPPRSTERQHFRLAALRDCAAIIASGGSSSALPYEAAIWLLEEEEEITGGQVPVGGQEVGGRLGVAGGVQLGAEALIGSRKHGSIAYAFENFARRLVHQFPNNSTARVCLALMLRRRSAHDGRPVPQHKRRQLEQLLADAIEDGKNDCASGYKALAELQYENRHYEQACATAHRGLRWLHSRRQKGHEALTQVALALRLALAKSLRRLQKLDEAESHFKALAGWVTEGEGGFSDMCGSTPVSVHQQALRGIALVAIARGDKTAARSQYERILGKAAMGRGPAEHWAHADYGWLLCQDGDLQGARSQLEQALKVALAEGCAATDSQVGEHHYRLGEVYWALKGRYKSDKQFAYTQFLEAAKVEGHAQAPALAALGRYFDEVERKPDQAARCYKKALTLDPSVEVAGDDNAAARAAYVLQRVES